MADYIRKNYRVDTLSVRDISSYAGLSTAYACTVFKSKTGKTMNQYLTDYRIEKAKHLLEDPRVRISEISSQVGYLDGNYFGKTFKKVTGLTPSEYREKAAVMIHNCFARLSSYTPRAIKIASLNTRGTAG